MTRTNLRVVATILATAAKCATAQNMIKNGSFDADATPWTLSEFGSWSNMENRSGDQSGSGSLQISSSTLDSAEQCVAVMPGDTYVFSAWIKKDPLRQFDPCASPHANLEIDWYSDSTCIVSQGLKMQNPATDPVPSGWYQDSITLTAPQNALSARAVLNDFCSTHHGTSIFYFDDVTFTSDLIFKGDFEAHAHEGGPGGT
jgi:hypothetical protein